MDFSYLLNWLENLPGPAMLAGAGVVAFAEAIVGLGTFLPGEAALMLASAMVDSIPTFLLLWAVATACSVVGNIVGFELGRRLGPPMRRSRFIEKYGAEGWDKAADLLHKHGTWAIFIGRLIPLVRSFVPAVAGTAGISYQRFLPPIALGAACATALPILVGVGVLAWLHTANTPTLIAAGIALVLAITTVFYRRRHRVKKQSIAANTHYAAAPDPRSASSCSRS